MSNQNTYETSEPSLQALLNQIHDGKLQLPDFQRPWVWDDSHIRALLASVSLSYPIGAIMLLEAGGSGARFRPRRVEGAPDQGATPELLILDGQQRLTSLFLALRSGRVTPTKTEKDEPIGRLYYLDIRGCLNPDSERLDAIVGLPEDRILRSDFNRRIDLDASTVEKEAKSELFPLGRVFDTAELLRWYNAYQKVHDFDKGKLEVFNRFQEQVLQNFQQYRVPVIKLFKTTPKEAVCQVFERVNTGGVALTVFELTTATFAAEDFQLQDDWKTRRDRFTRREHTPLRDVDGTDFLTAVTLFATYTKSQSGKSAVSCKRKDILDLSVADYKAHADFIEEGFARAERFLAREMIYDEQALPYHAQLIPLAAISAHLKDRFDEEEVRQKLVRWFWSGVLGELYGGANETRFALDMQGVLGWIEGGPEPRTVVEAAFIPSRLLSLQTRLSAAYKGIMALLMQVGSRDFVSGDPVLLNSYFDCAIEIHHVFPRSYCEKQRLPRFKWNSIVNKAAIAARTNRLLGGNAPSEYCASIERARKVTGDRLNGFLESHLMDPKALRSDDFDAFVCDRAARLLDLIERAMGKPVSGRDSDEVLQQFGRRLRASEAQLLPPRQAPPEEPPGSSDVSSDVEDEELSIDPTASHRPWRSDGKTWHLSRRCSPETAKVAERLVELVTACSPDIQVEWDQKLYIGFRVNGGVWATINTERKQCKLNLWTTEDCFSSDTVAKQLGLVVFNKAMGLSDKLALGSSVEYAKRGDYFRLTLRLRSDFSVDHPGLPDVLRAWWGAE